MSELGKKFDGSKPQMDLLSTEALNEIAKVMTYGASKYGRFNWRNGIAWSRIVSACMRHLSAFNDGEDLDPETGITHVAHAACNLMMLVEYIKTHPELDDRYNNGKAEGTERSRVSESSVKEIGKSEHKVETPIGTSTQAIETARLINELYNESMRELRVGSNAGFYDHPIKQY